MELFSKNKTQKTVLIQSRDYKRLKKIKVFNWFSFLIVVLTIASTSWFVYNDVYKTIGQIETLAIIKNIKSFESINFKLYEDTTKAWEEKNQKEKTVTPIRNLFNKSSTIAPTSTPQTTETTTSTNI